MNRNPFQRMKRSVRPPTTHHLVDSGEYTYGTEHLIIHSWDEGTRLRIGRFCSIADDVHVLLGGNHRVDWITCYPFSESPEANSLTGVRAGHPQSNGDVIVGNDVWIGSHASIMSGVRIGDGAVIAAFAHVVRDVQPYEIVGGNPAKHIRMRFDDKTIEALIRIEWWNWPLERILAMADILCSVPTPNAVAQCADWSDPLFSTSGVENQHHPHR